MANITLSIPDSLYEEMKKYKSINWSDIAREAIIKKLLELKIKSGEVSADIYRKYIKMLGVNIDKIGNIYMEGEEIKIIKERKKRVFK